MFVKKTGKVVVNLAKEFTNGLFNVIKWNDHNLNANTFCSGADNYTTFNN